jgi:hypothetical protein
MNTQILFKLALPFTVGVSILTTSFAVKASTISTVSSLQSSAPMQSNGQSRLARLPVTDHRDKLELAARRAIGGQEIRDFEVDGHRFHIKPVRITRYRDQSFASGSLSHILRFRPDDRVYYKIEKQNGVVQKAEITGIKRGGFRSIVGVKHLIPRGFLVTQLLEKLLNGTWEGAAEAIVVQIAAEL